jgi:LysM repeat protein
MNKLTELTSSSGNRSGSTQKNDNTIHTVKQGDTIWDIAKTYGVTTSLILEANNLTENSFLQIGDKLIIPGVKKATTSTDKNNDSNTKDDSNSNTGNTYTVKEGDCASSIAEDFGVSLASLLRLNNLTDASILKIGQVLIIPTDEQDTENNSTQNTSTTENSNNESSTSDNTKVTKGEYLDWFKEVQYILERGMTATVTDVATGKSFKIKRYQGHNHADVEPLTAEDTAIMKSIYGSWSWNRRAVIVNVNGQNIAGSMNGMPHGNGGIDNNNFSGHFCIHFKNSKTHTGNKVDKTHQAAVKKAAGL